jgi:hypothetical protein
MTRQNNFFFGKTTASLLKTHWAYKEIGSRYQALFQT